MSDLRRDYKWVLKVLRNHNNKKRHKQQLLTLINLFERKWENQYHNKVLYDLCVMGLYKSLEGRY